MSNITHEVSQMKRIIRRYELTDNEWERLQPYFPERQKGDNSRFQELEALIQEKNDTREIGRRSVHGFEILELRDL